MTASARLLRSVCTEQGKIHMLPRLGQDRINRVNIIMNILNIACTFPHQQHICMEKFK